jgi:chemotaxis protein MotB
MKAASSGLVLLAALAAPSLSGCFVAKSELTASETQNRVLVDQNHAQLVEIENLKTHSKQVEDQLIHAEQDLITSQQKSDLRQNRLGPPQGDADPLHRDFQSMAYGRRLPDAVRQQLIGLSQRCPSLHFDPETGISKLDTDVLFDSGQAELKPAAQQMLLELAQILQLTEAKDLKVMVVGHTDNQRITGGAAREKFGNNFHLSTARALAVADLLRSQGLTDHRIGVAGFGPHQPVVANDSPSDRQKNRRVEIFVMAPDVPVVGWSESSPSPYY